MSEKMAHLQYHSHSQHFLTNFNFGNRGRVDKVLCLHWWISRLRLKLEETGTIPSHRQRILKVSNQFKRQRQLEIWEQFDLCIFWKVSSFLPKRRFRAWGHQVLTETVLRCFRKTLFKEHQKRNPPSISLEISLKGSKRIFDFDKV